MSKNINVICKIKIVSVKKKKVLFLGLYVWWREIY